MQRMYATAKAPNDLTGASIWQPTRRSPTFMCVCKWSFGFKAHSGSLQCFWEPARTGCMYMGLGEAWRFHAGGIHLLEVRLEQILRMTLRMFSWFSTFDLSGPKCDCTTRLMFSVGTSRVWFAKNQGWWVKGGLEFDTVWQPAISKYPKS